MITLTDTAASKVRQLLEAEGADDLALRVAVRPGGCSGFSYEMFFDGDVAADDTSAGCGEAVKVIVDPASAQLLEGATLDYKDGLDESGFAITNPNASRTCGCGAWLRPDIVWFEDALDPATVAAARGAIAGCDLFVSVGTSGVVYPAAELPRIAVEGGAECVEINPEETVVSAWYGHHLRGPASKMLRDLCPA